MGMKDPSDLASQTGEKIDTVLETMAVIGKPGGGVVLTIMEDGKFKATSLSWDEGKVILPDQVMEIRMVDGRIRVARKEKRRDTGDLQRAAEPAGAEGEITEYLGA